MKFKNILLGTIKGFFIVYILLFIVQLIAFWMFLDGHFLGREITFFILRISVIGAIVGGFAGMIKEEKTKNKKSQVKERKR